MGKRIFGIFLLLILAATASGVAYIQSESFARLAKAKLQEAVARDMGLELNFDRLKVGMLPPSVSLLHVDLKVKEKTNSLGLSTNTVFKVDRLGFSFRMIQAFSRGIAVNKVFMDRGEVRLTVPKKKSSGPAEKLSDLVHKPIRVPLADGFVANIRQLELKNTVLDISWSEDGQPFHASVGNVGYLAITPSSEGTNLVANLEELALDTPKIKEKLQVLKLNADVRKDQITLATLDVQRREAALHAAGKITGSIDDLLNGKPEIDLIVRSPLAEFTDFEPAFRSFQGELLADVKLVGRLQQPIVQGKLEVDRFRYSMWELDKIQAVGSFGNGLLTLDTLSLQKNAGRIYMKSKAEIPIPFQPESRSLTLHLENAKFEEFSGDLKKSVNNLRMNLSGSLGVKLDFSQEAKLSSIQIQPDLSVRDLELNNQIFSKQRPYKKIFQVQPFQLNGSVLWRQGEVRVQEAKVTLGSGVLDVKGTVSSNKGFDLTAITPSVDVTKEVGEISSIPIMGVGGVRVHVRGPMEAVSIDFDVKQKDVKFLGFDFGEVDGRITYDEKNSYIHLSDVKGRKNSAIYKTDGRVNVGEGDDISITASFAESDPNDLFTIFAKQLEKITWLPKGMGGTVEGTVKVGGGYSQGLESLQISTLVHGKNWSYVGEILHEIDARTELNKGVLKAQIIKARKYETPVSGEIEYKLSGEMKYVLDIKKGKLRSLDTVTALGFPVDGLFSLHSEGQGKWETLVSDTTFELRNSFVRTKPMPSVDFAYQTRPDHSDFQLRFGANAEVTGRIAHSAKANSSAALRFENAEFDFLLCALSRRNCTDPSLTMLMSAEGQSSWKGSDWKAMTGSGVFRSVEMGKSGFRLRSPSPVPISANQGVLEIAKLLLEGEQSKLRLRLKGNVDGTGLDNQIQGDVSFRLLELLSPVIEEASGKLGIALGLTGNLNDSRFNGRIDLHDGFLRLAGVDAPVDAIEGAIRFADNRVTIDTITGEIGGGSVQASGTMDLYLNKAPRFDVDLYLANNRVKFFPVNFAEISDGKLSFTGEKAPYLFGGTVRMKRVMMRNNFDLGGARKGTQNAKYLPEKVGGSKSFYEIRIKALAESGVFVDNNLLNAEFRGEVTLLNNFEFPQVVARAELVRGKLLFRNTAFALEQAYIRVPNPEYFNPQFSIGPGVATVDNYRITIFASGTMDKPKISLSSYPSIPQEDIVSLLAFGYRGEDARKIDPNNTSAVTYSEVGSILLEQMQLNQNLQSKGLRVGIVPALNETEASIIRPDSTQTAAPKVYLQTQIMKNLEAAFGGTVGSAQGQSLDGKLEYKVGRKASVSAVYEQAPAGLDATEINSSYGADLKFRWGFK